jgi:predicted O-methyltransferase YrrM
LIRIQRLERLVKRRSLQKPVDRLWALWSSVWEAWWSRHLAGIPDYSFTTDYVARHAEVWREHLAPLMGASGVRLLEIGSLEGRSALWFLENILTHATATITCVDPFVGPGVEARFDHNIKLSGHAAKVTKIKGPSEAVLPDLAPASYDAIYVDGAHLAVNVLMDAVLSWRLVKTGGVLIFDDYTWAADRAPWRRPQMGVDLFLGMVGSDAVVLDKDAQVIVRKLGPPADSPRRRRTDQVGPATAA